MLFPTAFHPLHDQIQRHLSHLRPARMIGLALWGATVMAPQRLPECGSGGPAGPGPGLAHDPPVPAGMALQRIRPGRALPGAAGVEACFAPLLRRVPAWWEGTELTLAVDPTVKGGELVALVVSVASRGLAIPVA